MFGAKYDIYIKVLIIMQMHNDVKSMHEYWCQSLCKNNDVRSYARTM